MATKQDISRSNGSTSAIGRVPATRSEGSGPTIWLAGDPNDLKEWMPMGITGVVLNTVVHNEYAQNHGSALRGTPKGTTYCKVPGPTPQPCNLDYFRRPGTATGSSDCALFTRNEMGRNIVQPGAQRFRNDYI